MPDQECWNLLPGKLCQRHRSLLEVARSIASHSDLTSLFHDLGQHLHSVVQFDSFSLILHDPSRNVLRVQFLESSWPTPDQWGIDIAVEETPYGWVWQTQQPLIICDLTAETRFTNVMQSLREYGIQSFCLLPLTTAQRRLGVLALASANRCDYHDAEVEFLQQVASQVAVAVDNALNAERAQALQQQLTDERDHLRLLLEVNVLAFRQIEELNNRLAEEKLYLEDEIRTAYNFEEIIGQSGALRQILRDVETVAPTDSTILIQGETGTGKELIARAIHNLSTRRERTFVKVNCAAIPMGLLESELFGHEKGAFTGAIAQRIGRFELAHQGTLFLDEIGDIPLELQPKLLRVLQEQEFERLGSSRTIRVDTRLIAATNRDLAQMVVERQFRSDLYYRLNVFPITILPLRERREDIPLLVRYFAHKHARRIKKRIESIPTDTIVALMNYPWPGNVRELENFIERAVILSRGPQLQVPLAALKLPAETGAPHHATTLEAAEREHILRVLDETHWVIAGSSGAAARLGMKRTTLNYKMRKLGICRPTE